MRVERSAGRFGEDDDCYTFENFKPERKLPLLLVAIEPTTKINKNCFNEASSKYGLVDYKRKLLLLQIRATGRRRLRQYHHPQSSIRSCVDTRQQRGQICVSSAKNKDQMMYQESLSICNRVPDICAPSESPRHDDVRSDENGYSYILNSSLDNDCEGSNAQNRSSLQSHTSTSTRKEQKQKYKTSTNSDGFDRLPNDVSELLESPVDIQIGCRYKIDINSPSSTTCGDICPLSDEKIDHQGLMNTENRNNKRTSLSSTAQSFTKWSVVTSSTRPSSTSAFASDGSTSLSTSTTPEGQRKGVRVFESLFCRSSKLEAKNEWFVNPSETTMGATKQTMVMDVFDGASNRINKYKVMYNA